jgi:hypothetical protein
MNAQQNTKTETVASMGCRNIIWLNYPPEKLKSLSASILDRHVKAACTFSQHHPVEQT